MARKASMKTILARQKKYADAEVDTELRDTGQELKTADEHVVREWSHKPGFKAKVYSQPFYKSVEVKPTGPNAAIWYYVDLGTKPHVIKAKNVPLLKGQLGYSARTAPVAKSGLGTGTASGAWFAAKEVNHPGTAPRKFNETFFKELEPPFEDRIQNAVARGLAKGKR